MKSLYGRNEFHNWNDFSELRKNGLERGQGATGKIGENRKIRSQT